MSHDHRGVRAWHVLAGALALGVAACAGILGIDDRQLDTSDGGAQKDGGTTDGPSTGDGPATGDGPSTGDSPSQSDTGTADTGAADAGCDGPCILATGLNHPYAMTSDSNNVYWTEYGDMAGTANGSLKSCPVSGCGAGPKILASGLANPEFLAVDATSIYFTTGGGMINGSVWKCPLSGCGGSPTKLADGVTPDGIALDATNVYWSDYSAGTIHRVQKSGGTDTVLYDAGDGLITNPLALVVDGTAAYVTDYSGNVFRAPIGGGSASQMVSSIATGPLKVDSNALYVGVGGGIMAMSKTGTDGGPLIATSLQTPAGIALDPPTSRLYWADNGAMGNDGTVGRVGLDGGAQTQLASSLTTPEDVTVTGNYAFWLSYGDLDDGGGTLPGTGQLYRLPK